jgi:ABC-2 type transport system ATP-binding protein
VAVIAVEDLRRSYGAFEALRGVSFSVEAGEIVGLLGPNGAGKTTALRILVGLLAPTAGRAMVAGHDVLLDPIAARRAIGWLPEGAPSYEESSVQAFLTFVARVRGLGPAETRRAIDSAATDCGITDRLRQQIGTLSRGYRQRVGLAAALLHAPPLLILDEPTTGLDPNQVAEIRSLVRRLGTSRTVLLSTHILSEVEAVCDRVLILHHGRLVADDRTATILAGARGTVVTFGIGAGKVHASPQQLQRDLEALPGVRAVRIVAPLAGEHRFEIHSDDDLRPALFTWAVAGGHQLVEMTPTTRNLEEVFRRLTEASA